MKYSFTIETPQAETLDSALKRVKVRRELADALGGPTRPLREYASDIFAQIARLDPKELLDFQAEIIDALDRPESLTRYNMLETILELSRLNPKIVITAFDPIEDCLYDEDSGTVRLYAFRVFAHYGATGTARSMKVWTDLSEAIRCYHGDPEFIPMLNEVITMLGGKVDQKVKDAAAELFAFDADNGKGTLKRKAAAITAFAPEVIKRLKAEAARIEKQKAEDARKAAEEAAAAAAEEEEEEE
jgi:hypothetical protein